MLSAEAELLFVGLRHLFMQIRKRYVATVCKLEPDFRLLSAAGAELGYTDFTWFVFPALQVQRWGGLGEGTEASPSTPPPARTGHFELVFWSDEFFLPLFGTAHEKHSCLLLFYGICLICHQCHIQSACPPFLSPARMLSAGLRGPGLPGGGWGTEHPSHPTSHSLQPG